MKQLLCTGSFKAFLSSVQQALPPGGSREKQAFIPQTLVEALPGTDNAGLAFQIERRQINTCGTEFSKIMRSLNAVF